MPDSILVVGLVIGWLVVLVPMLARHRQEVRRTTDAALATRVLHRGGEPVGRGRRARTVGGRPEHEHGEVDDMGEERAMEHEVYEDGVYQDGVTEDGVTEVLPAVTELAPRRRSGRGGFDPQADAVARRARYAARQRVASVLFALALVTLVAATLGVSALWWPHLAVDLTLVGYLTFLRRQTRIESEVRERRLARMDRARLGIDTVDEADPTFEAVPARLRRPGAVVLEIDDEDPAFDELEPPYADEELELPRASGQ